MADATAAHQPLPHGLALSGYRTSMGKCGATLTMNGRTGAWASCNACHPPVTIQ